MRAGDEGHGIARRENLIALLVRVDAFLDRYVAEGAPVAAEGRAHASTTIRGPDHASNQAEDRRGLLEDGDGPVGED